MKGIANIVLMLTLLFLCGRLSAAEIATEWNGKVAIISLDGELIPGDYENLAKSILDVSSLAKAVHINIDSPGGSVYEANRIADLIRDLGYPVYIKESGICASSCFLIYTKATFRSALSGEVNVHRPYFHKKFYAESDPSLSMTVHRAAISKYKELLEDASVPADIIDLAISRSSDDALVLTREQLSRIGVTPPWVEELLISECSYKAAEVRQATFERTLSFERRLELMDHSGEVFGRCWLKLSEPGRQKALSNLRKTLK